MVRNLGGFEVRKVFEHVDKLAYEIGPRRAGEKGDELATRYVSEKLRECGLQTSVMEFEFVRETLKEGIMAIIGLIGFLPLIVVPGFQSLFLWIAVLAIIGLSGQVLPKKKTWNVVARRKTDKGGRHIVLMAHRDSAVCITRPGLARLAYFLFYPTFVLATFTLILRLLFHSIWPTGWVLSTSLFILLSSAIFLSKSQKEVSPGANDNASGVSILLEVARVCSESSPSCDLTFVITGAGEEGAIGAKKLLSDGVLRGDETVLNLDTVGVGKNGYVISGTGVIRRMRTPRELNEELKVCMREAGFDPRNWWATFSGYEHAPLLHAGVKAITLTTDVRSRKSLSQKILSKLLNMPATRERGYEYIHTPHDLPDKLDLNTVEKVGNVVLKFIGVN